MKALIGAFGFLTVIPTGGTFPQRPGRVFAWFPLVGLLIGAVIVAAARLPLPDLLRAVIVVLVWVVVTGGLHLDGFGDACDGLLATVPIDRRLAIMKDSRAGSWAVVGLVLLLVAKIAALEALGGGLVLLLPPVMGRWAMVLAAWAFPYARKQGLGGLFREGLNLPQVIVASLTAAAVAAFSGGWLVVTIPLLTVALGGTWAAHRLGGGLTGDVYGGLCELTELFCLIGLLYGI